MHTQTTEGRAGRRARGAALVLAGRAAGRGGRKGECRTDKREVHILWIL